MNRKWTWFSWVVLMSMLLGCAGCGGFSGSVPVSPMMFIQNDAPLTPASGPATNSAPILAQAR